MASGKRDYVTGKRTDAKVHTMTSVPVGEFKERLKG